MKWIDTNSIRNWAARRDCQENLPLLIRKLIRATSDSIKHISFPAGDNVLIGGWDGILEVYEETEYLPLGLSLWEFGSNSDIKGKANSDYETRKTDTLGYDPEQVCYVFITPRLWTKKEDWIAEKTAEGFWKEIRVYDAEDLEEWIEIAPAVGAWLAVKHLSLFPQGIQPADDFWEEWSTGNKIRLNPAVVLAGRGEQVQKILQQATQPVILPVRATSREEAIAFIVAAFKNADSLTEDFFARALIVDTLETFRELSVFDKPLYLIIRFEDDNVINKARSKGHVVYVPLGVDNSGQWTHCIDLPALEREAFLEALIGCGIERNEAEKLSKRSARNLSVLRRQLEFNRLIPVWAQANLGRDLIPAILAQRWDEDMEGDRKVIEDLAGEGYEAYVAKLKQWLYTADAPIVKIGSTWRLTSPLDAWTHAGKYCTRVDFEHLATVFKNVFNQVDPKFDLQPEERHRSSWYGVRQSHSRWLREGVIQSLIMISVYGEKIGIDLPVPAESWVDGAIADLLLTDDPALWKSFDHELPLIAEASPAKFLVRLEALLKLAGGPIHQLFEEEKDYLHNNSYHTGLLWALENVAWMPEQLTRSALSLAGLAEIDPGGALANRPVNSLYEIFKSWFPQTLATLPERLEALKVMLGTHRQIARKLIKSLLPSGRGTASPTHRMRWRLSEEPVPYGVSYDELYKTYTAAIGMLIGEFDGTEDSFGELVEISYNLNHWDRETVLTFLEEQLDKISHDKHITWHQLRKEVGRHRTYPNSDWALPEEVLTRYHKMYNSLTPADPFDQISWILKEPWPQSIDGRQENRDNYAEHARLIHEKKVDAAKMVYKDYGFDKLIAVSDELSGTELQPFAFAVAEVINDQTELLRIYDGLKTDGLQRDFAQSIIFKKRQLHGDTYIFELYHDLVSKGFEHQALANLFLRLNADRPLWDFIDTTTQPVIDAYWSQVDSYYFYIPVKELIYAINRLTDHERFTTALRIASHSAENLEEELLVKLLMNFVTHKPEANARLDSYDIEHIFEELRKKGTTDRNIFIKLEWLYLPVLDRGSDDRNTPLLHQEMADNAEFFMQVLEQSYKTEADDQEQYDGLTNDEIQQKVMMAESAYKLLYSWNIIPGIDSEGKIDENKLRQWVEQVVTLAKASDRVKFAYGKIGSVFAKYPETNQKMEPDKALDWPPDILCEIMEGINSEDLFDHFKSAAYNKRGFSSRGPFDGGARERHIAAYFKKLSGSKAAKFPHVAAILDGLAKDFEHQAKWEDERAERNRLDY